MTRTNGAHPPNGHARRSFFKPKHERSASTIKLNRQFGKRKTLIRLLVAVCLAAAILMMIRDRWLTPVDNTSAEAEQTLLLNCVGIEPLRHADECFEDFKFSRSKQVQQLKRHMKQKSTHLEHEENIPYVSPYGLVLDYDAVYDRLAPDREDELHTTKRTLKCLTGFHMSIVWDVEFSTPLLQAYDKGAFGLNPDVASSEVAASCPPSTSDSSASMSIKINCGLDIERDAWGHPATEQDHEELETCIRMAWSWVKGRVGEQAVGPWHELCQEGPHGISCNRDVFHLEGAD